MADDLNRLLIKLEADTSKLRAALKDAENGVDRTTKNMERSLARNQGKWTSFGKMIEGTFLKFAAGYGAIQLAANGIEAVRITAELEDQAQAAGVTTDAFQELSYAAKLSGASTDDLAKGLDKFSVSVAQVRLNTGAFNQFLKDQAPALRDALAATTSQEQAVAVLSDAMAGLGDDSQRATLLQQAFGKSSRELIGVLSEGRSALAAAADEAHRFGLVITNEDIQAAKSAAAEFAKLEMVFTTTFERAAIGAANFGISVAKSLAHPVELLEKMNSLSGAAIGGVGARGRSPMATAPLSGPTLKGWDAVVTKDPTWGLQPKPDSSGVDKLAALNRQVLDAQGQLQQALQASYNQELAEFQRMLDNKQISEQQFAEARSQLGILMAERVKDNLGAETELQRVYYSALRDNMQSTFMNTFSNALETGKFKFKDFLRELLVGFAKITTEVLVLKPLLDGLFGGMGGGGGKGILGSLLGGFLASGGPAEANTPYIVGEKGPELFVPNASGRVMNARQTRGLLSADDEVMVPNTGRGSGIARASTGGTTVINYSPTIDARGADIGVLHRIEAAQRKAAMAQQNPITTTRQAQKRFPTRG